MDAIQIYEDMSNKFPESTISLTKQKKTQRVRDLRSNYFTYLYLLYEINENEIY